MFAAKFVIAIIFGTTFVAFGSAQAEGFSKSDAEKGIVKRFVSMGLEGMRDQMIRSGTPKSEVDRAVNTALETYATCYIEEAAAQADDQNLNLQIVLKFFAGLEIHVDDQQTIAEFDMDSFRERSAPCKKRLLEDTR